MKILIDSIMNNLRPFNSNENELLAKDRFMNSALQQDYKQSKNTSFREYYENKERRVHREKILNRVNNPVYDNIARYEKEIDIDTTNNNALPLRSRTYERKSIVMIDSSVRDKNKYPLQNDFKISFGESFRNVKQISLVSSTFPNSDQVIKDRPSSIKNNVVTWENEEDSDLGVKINVTLTTVVADHVDIIVPSHNLENQKYVGQLKVRLFNTTSLPNLDGEWYVDIIDVDTLRFKYINGILIDATAGVDLGIPNYTTELEPGSYTVKTIAEQIQTQLKRIKRRNGTGAFHYFNITPNLDTDVLTFQNALIAQLKIGAITTSSGSTIVEVDYPNHGLKHNDTVLMIGVKAVGGIPVTALNGNFSVILTGSNNTFQYEVSERATSGESGGGSAIKVGKISPFRFLFNTSKSLIVNNIGFSDEDSSVKGEGITFSTTALEVQDIEIYSQDVVRITTTTAHLLEQATVLDISTISNTNPVIVTTTVPHNLGSATRAVLANTNTVPSLNGEYSVKSVGENKIQINNVSITVGGTTGKIKFGGDRVKIYNLKTNPSIESINFFIVENIVSSTVFDIELRISFVSAETIPLSIIGTSQLYVNHPSHKFNEITSITTSGVNEVRITTMLNHGLTGKIYTAAAIETIVNNSVDIVIPVHGLSTSDAIILKESTSTPNINGRYFVQIIDGDTVRINFTGGITAAATATVYTGDRVILSNTNSTPSVDSDDSGNILYNLHTISPTEFDVILGYTVTTDGDYGVIGRNQKVVFYRVEGYDTTNSIGGIDIDAINGVYRNIDKIIDGNNYMIRVDNRYSNVSVTGKGGSNVCISSSNYGYRTNQLNTVDGTVDTKLYKSIRLSGEDFLFLVIPGLHTVSYPSVGNLGDIFAIIQLNQPPGYTLYNSYVSAPKVFYKPLSVLDGLYMTVKRKDGILFNFNNIDYIITLEITELVSEFETLDRDKINNETSFNAGSSQKAGKSGTSNTSLTTIGYIAN